MKKTFPLIAFLFGLAAIVYSCNQQPKEAAPKQSLVIKDASPGIIYTSYDDTQQPCKDDSLKQVIKLLKVILDDQKAEIKRLRKQRDSLTALKQ